MSAPSEYISTKEAYLEEGQMISDAVKHSDTKLVRYDHKDGLHRYANAKSQYMGKDHYLKADDGKLKVLRVQVAPNNRTASTNVPWERPRPINPFKALWRAFRRSPSEIIRWTFDGSLKGKVSSFWLF